MTSKEALNYIKNHSVWQFAAVHGMTEVDENLVESFNKIDNDLEVLEILKNHTDLRRDKLPNNTTYYFLNGREINKETYDKLKEWLEND